jgi:dephospho-CoA kinase
MLRVGLTGSIAVGKSFVAGVLRDLGCLVLDADQTARDVVALGKPGLRAVVEAFGRNVLEPSGALNRARLGAIVFGDENKRTQLNSILHPYIIAAQNRILDQWNIAYPDSIAVVDAALMIESGSYKRFDRIVVVFCSPDVQLERLMARNYLSLEDARRRILAQMSQSEKIKYADYLIDTSDGFDSTRQRTEQVFHKLQLELKAGVDSSHEPS